MVLGNPELTWFDLDAVARCFGYASAGVMLYGACSVRVCDHCGRTYGTRNTDQKYCSIACANKHRRVLADRRAVGVS